MKIIDVMTELREMYSEDINQRGSNPRRLSKDDLQRWSSGMNMTISELYNQIATCLTIGFHDAELSFSFCDAVVGDLSGVFPIHEALPDLFLAST